MDQELKDEFDNLGRMIKGGFDGVDKRFDKVEVRLNKVEEVVKDLKATLITQYPTKYFLTEELAKLGVKIDGKTEKDLKFKIKVIDIFKRLKAAPEDISELEKIVEFQIESHVSK